VAGYKPGVSHLKLDESGLKGSQRGDWDRQGIGVQMNPRDSSEEFKS
jgi:hypothetical protein